MHWLRAIVQRESHPIADILVLLYQPSPSQQALVRPKPDEGAAQETYLKGTSPMPYWVLLG